MKDDQLKSLIQFFRDGRELRIDNTDAKWRQIMSSFRAGSSDNPGGLSLINGRLVSVSQAGHMQLVSQNLRKMQSLVAMTNPIVSVTPNGPNNDVICQILDKHLNILSEKIKLDRTLSVDALMYALVFGTAIAYCGYESVDVPGMFPYAKKPGRKSVEELGIEGDLLFGTQSEVNPNIQKNQPVVKIINPYFISTNPAATSVDEIRHIFYVRLRPQADVRFDSRYDSDAAHDVPPLSHAEAFYNDPVLTGLTQDMAEHEKICAVVQCFDVATKQFCVFHPEVEKPLIDWTPSGIDRMHSPFVWFTPIKDPLSPFGQPYAMQFVDIADAYNKINRRLFELIVQHGKVTRLFDSNVFTPNIMAQIRDGDGEIGIPGLSELNQTAAIKELTQTPFPPELARMAEQFWSMLGISTGLTDAARNQPTTNQTATEATIRMQQMGTLVADMRARYREFYDDVCENVLRVVLSKWDEEQMIRVAGNDPALFFWTKIGRDRISQEFNINVSVGQSENPSPEVLTRQWNELLPRLQALIAMANQEAAIARQGGPQSIVDVQEVIRITVERYCPSYAARILRQQNPLEMLVRAIAEGIVDMSRPDLVSPALQSMLGDLMYRWDIMTHGIPTGAMPNPQQLASALQINGAPVGANATPSMEGGGVPSFEESNGVPKPEPILPFGMTMDSPAMQSGRMLSETPGAR